MYSYAVPLSEDQGTRSAPCQKPGELTACRLSAAPWLFYQISRNLSIHAGIKDPPRAAARGGFCIERGLLNVVVDDGGGLVELFGVGQQALEVLERGGVIEAVADALVGVDGVVDVLAAHDRAVVEHFVLVVFAAEGDERVRGQPVLGRQVSPWVANDDADTRRAATTTSSGTTTTKL